MGGGVMVANITIGTKKAIKHHQCFECYRSIAPQEKYGFQTNAYDGSIYTLKWHLDCAKCASEYRHLHSINYDDDGYPPEDIV